MVDRRFTIVGAGLGGTLMACYLGRAGHRVDVYERRPDPRQEGADGGRSINLAISTRALHALGEVGLAERVLAGAVPMRGRMMHDESGRLSFQPYGTRPDDVINSVSRGGLNLTLLEAADALPTVSLHFSHRVQDVDLDEGTVSLVRDGQIAVSTDPAVVIGGDGAFSAVRGRLQKTDRFDYSQSYLAHGYKELTIPPGEGGAFRLEPNALHIWPRGGYMMIALPNQDGSFTCTLFWPFTGPYGLTSLRTESDVNAFFTTHFPDAVPLMPELAEEYLANPNSSLVTVRCAPWHYGDRVVLVGDACHAVVPFYGQGANAAFEDCTILAAALVRHGEDVGAAFAEYSTSRKPDVDVLADLAIANFVEMRDRVSSPLFLMKKQWEKRLHRWFPSWYLPLYSMVTFSRIPYAEAVKRSERQNRIVGAMAAAVTLFLVLGLALLWN